MKTSLIAILTIVALNAPAFAGSLGNPWERPGLIEPERQLSWDGPYAGAGLVIRDVTTYTTQEQDTGLYERECRLGTDGTPHQNNKCVVSEATWDYLEETGQLDHVNQPWNTLPADGIAGDSALYQSGYHGLWLNDKDVTFTTPVSDASPVPSLGQMGVNTLVGAIKQTITTAESDTELSGDAFVGYRRTVGKIGLGLEAGAISGLEAQVAYSHGRVFAYTGVNTEHQNTLGVDVLLGQGKTFIGGKIGADHIEARFGVTF